MTVADVVEPDWALLIEHLCHPRIGLSTAGVAEALGRNREWVNRWQRGERQRMSWRDGEVLLGLARLELDVQALIDCRVPER